MIQYFQAYFNSIKVQLEHKIFERSESVSRNFNSIKVQLEQDNPREVCRKLNYFNSIKVQLERINPQVNTNFQKFQFHKGTIRTSLPYISYKDLSAISIP